MTTKNTPRYRVTAPYITARSTASAFGLGEGRPVSVFGYHRGVLLPADVPHEQIASFLRKGLVEEVPDAA